METGNSVTPRHVKRQTPDSQQLSTTHIASSSSRYSSRLTAHFCKGASAANLGASQFSRGQLGHILEGIRFGGNA